MAVDRETQFHVLAVDDSLIDRKLIERLLKTSSYQGTFDHRFLSSSPRNGDLKWNLQLRNCSI